MYDLRRHCQAACLRRCLKMSHCHPHLLHHRHPSRLARRWWRYRRRYYLGLQFLRHPWLLGHLQLRHRLNRLTVRWLHKHYSNHSQHRHHRQPL